MEKKQKSEVFSKFHNLRSEISNLRNRLNEINAEKEKWFKIKEEIKKQVFGLIKKIKEIKNKKDGFNVNVSKFKENRDNHNKKVKELISKIKELNKEKIQIFKKSGIKEDPERIKERIERLELSIQTEGFSFEREK